MKGQTRCQTDWIARCAVDALPRFGSRADPRFKEILGFVIPLVGQIIDIDIEVDLMVNRLRHRQIDHIQS